MNSESVVRASPEMARLTAVKSWTWWIFERKDRILWR